MLVSLEQRKSNICTTACFARHQTLTHLLGKIAKYNSMLNPIIIFWYPLIVHVILNLNFFLFSPATGKISCGGLCKFVLWCKTQVFGNKSVHSYTCNDMLNTIKSPQTHQCWLAVRLLSSENSIQQLFCSLKMKVSNQTSVIASTIWCSFIYLISWFVYFSHHWFNHTWSSDSNRLWAPCHISELLWTICVYPLSCGKLVSTRLVI
jgi:hypothetical protein